MKFRNIVCIALIIASLLAVAGCNRNTEQSTTTATLSAITTTTKRPIPTTTEGYIPNPNLTTTRPKVTTTSGDWFVPTINDTSALEIKKISVNGLPVVVGDTRNQIKVSAAGLLNGNEKNPMFLLVTNIGEDDIYSATITASAAGTTIKFNISYLPRGGSVWAESTSGYKYSASDEFTVNSNAVIVSAASAGVAIDRSYNGILKIYADEKDGGKGIFIENVSGKKIKKVVIKYRPVASGAGLYAAPWQQVITNFENGSKIFKANSYLHDVYVVDVQITY